MEVFLGDQTGRALVLEAPVEPLDLCLCEPGFAAEGGDGGGPVAGRQLQVQRGALCPVYTSQATAIDT